LIMKQAKLFGSDEELKVLGSFEYAKAKAVALQVEEVIKPLCDRFEIVGSVRRKKAMVGDCDFVVVATDANWAKIVSTIKKAQVICAGPNVTKLNVPYENCLFQVDFYRAKLKNFGIQMLVRTGSAGHNMWLASYALSTGFRLKYGDGLLKDRVVVAGESEEGVFAALDLPFPGPEQREVVEGKPAWMKA
jgi:DNA polymerase (family 10)